MAKLLQTTVTGSLNISGSSLVMPLLTGSTDVHSGSAGQLWINNEGALNLKFTQVGSYGSQNSPFSCLGAWSAGGNMSTAKACTAAAGTAPSCERGGSRRAPRAARPARGEGPRGAAAPTPASCRLRRA